MRYLVFFALMIMSTASHQSHTAESPNQLGQDVYIIPLYGQKLTCRCYDAPWYQGLRPYAVMMALSAAPTIARALKPALVRTAQNCVSIAHLLAYRDFNDCVSCLEKR